MKMTGPPTDARGTVKISYYVAATKTTFRAEGTVDCLVTKGNYKVRHVNLAPVPQG